MFKPLQKKNNFGSIFYKKQNKLKLCGFRLSKPQTFVIRSLKNFNIGESHSRCYWLERFEAFRVFMAFWHNLPNLTYNKIVYYRSFITNHLHMSLVFGGHPWDYLKNPCIIKDWSHSSAFWSLYGWTEVYISERNYTAETLFK